MEAHIRKGCTMACNSVRVRGTRVGQVCHHSRVRSVSSLVIVSHFRPFSALFDHFQLITDHFRPPFSDFFRIFSAISGIL